jgi:hypothetical protein
MNEKSNELVRREIITGSRRFSNYLLTIVLTLGGIGFVLSGCSSYFKINLLPFADPTQLTFIPQGIIMLFYGVVALTISIYIILTIIWDIGSGYNEFNKEENVVRIARNGFPGKNRKILLSYSIKNIKSIKLSIEDGLNPKRAIYLCTKDQRQIPLTPVEQPRSLQELELQASTLSKFLEVSLEGI